jgi:hypothetical protein
MNDLSNLAPNLFLIQPSKINNEIFKDNEKPFTYTGSIESNVNSKILTFIKTYFFYILRENFFICI